MDNRASARVLIGFTIITLCMTYPLLWHFPHALQDRQDPLLNVWIISWEARQLLEDPFALYQANIFHPHPHALTYSEILFPNAVLAVPLLLITNNRVLVYNVLFWATFILSAFGAYLLTYHLTGKRGAGFIAALIFAFSPYRFGHLSQLQLLTMQWMPFTLLCLHRALASDRKRGKWFFLTAFFFVLQALSSFYYAFYLAFAIALYALVFFIAQLPRSKIFSWSAIHCALRGALTGAAGEPAATARKLYQRGDGANLPLCRFAYLLLAMLGAGVIILPFIVPYYQTRAAQGIENDLAINEHFSASIQAYLYHAPENLLYGRVLARFAYDYGECCPPDYLFPGIVAPLLALYAIFAMRRSPRPRAALSVNLCVYTLLALFAFIMSLGPTFHWRALQPIKLPFSLPYRFFFDHFPGFTAMRAPVRFASLLTLALAVLAGIGVSNLPQPRRGKSAVGFLLSGLILLEYLALPVGVVPVAVGGDIPPVYRWLAEQPRTVVLELPLAAHVPSNPLPAAPTPRDRWAATNLLQYQYFSTYHWHTTPDGYSGFIPPRHGEFAYELADFPSERAVSLLQGFGVTYLLLHREYYPAAEWQRLQTALPDFPDLHLVQIWDDVHVYRVAPRAMSSAQLAFTAYYPPTAPRGAPYTVYLIPQNRSARSFVALPTEKLTVRVAWGYAALSDMQITAAPLPLVITELAIVPVALTAPTEPGAYPLAIWVDQIPGEPSALPAPIISGTVQVVPAAGSTAQPLPVRLTQYEADRAAYQPGDAVRIKLCWHALAKIDAYYSLFLRLVAPDGNIVARWDGQPQHGAAPTLHWRPDTIITDPHELAIPPTAPRGAYTLEIGFYNPADLSPRLILDDREQFVPQLHLPIVVK